MGLITITPLMSMNSSDDLRNKLTAMARLCVREDGRHQCGGCSPRDRMACTALASEAAGEVLSGMVLHFGRQEHLMKASGLYRRHRDECERHMQDHGDMSEAAARWLARAGDGPLVPRVAELSGVLGSWLERHGEEYDRWFEELLRRG